jgi:hypothetical protein
MAQEPLLRILARALGGSYMVSLTDLNGHILVNHGGPLLTITFKPDRCGWAPAGRLFRATRSENK